MHKLLFNWSSESSKERVNFQFFQNLGKNRSTSIISSLANVLRLFGLRIRQQRWWTARQQMRRHGQRHDLEVQHRHH